MTELEQLEKISRNFGYSEGVMAASIDYCFSILLRHLKGKNILELGPAEGLMTEMLVKTGFSITVVEGSSKYCESINQRFPQVDVFHSLFEDYQPTAKFDNIILGHVLEHVSDPTALLSKIRGWLTANGRIFAAVPNARSIHRQAAVMMDMLASEDTLNDMDLHHGHRRVFNPESFRSIFSQAGLRVDIFGGYWLKPISNGQIESDWTPQMIKAFMQLGERYPDIAGEIYVLASDSAAG